MPRDFNPYLEAALLQKQAGEIGLDKLSDHETYDGIEGTISPLDFPMELGSLLVGAGKQVANPAMWSRIMRMERNQIPVMGLGAFTKNPYDGMNLSAIQKILQEKVDNDIRGTPIKIPAYRKLHDSLLFEERRVKEVLDAAEAQKNRVNPPSLAEQVNNINYQKYLRAQETPGTPEYLQKQADIKAADEYLKRQKGENVVPGPWKKKP